MKKFLDYACMLMIVMVGMCMSSCSDDDDDSVDATQSSIVGKWERSGTDGTEFWTFEKGGKYKSVNTSFPSYTQYRNGTYKIADGMLLIDIKAVEGGNSAYSKHYMIYSLSESSLVLMDMDYGDWISFTR